MPYGSIKELPKSVRNLPGPAKTIYLKAFNNAWEDEDKSGSEISREKAAHEAAWSAVKEEYEKDCNSGEWVRIGKASGASKSRHLHRYRRTKSGDDSQSRAHA